MNNFKEQLSKETSCIDNIIEKYLPEAKGHAEYIKSAMDYSVEAGGKRIRPMIMLETYKLCNGTNEEELYPFMAALEMIHTYSLVHDDLPAMDNDDYRRGKLTTHKKFGEDFGILAGDGLLNLAYETMLSAIHKAAKTGDAQAVLRYSAAADVIANKAGVDGMVGFFKKLVIADNLGMFVDYVYQTDYFAGVHVILAIFAFSIQIYCDFSGYSDIAIGTAKLFNINLIKNFDSPYFSASVKEFWRRWHISLSNWFRDYLYIPLGGNRRGFIVSKLNVIFVFLVSGLWHGAGWNYVVWGGMHGVAQLFNNRKVNKNVKHNAVWWLKVLLTFLFVTLTWMVFRLGITETVNMLSGLSWRWCSFSESMDRIVDNTLLTHAKLALVAVCAVLLMVYDYFSLKRDLLKEFGRLNVVVRCAVYVFMIMFILFEMPLVVTSRFIYFQF